VRFALPFALLHFAVFLALGLHLPFWPLWLSDRGLSSEDIGLLLAVAAWIRIAATPVIGQAADRWRHGRLLIPLLALSAAAGYGGFLAAESFLLLLVLQAVTFTSFMPLIPLADARTLEAGRRYKFDYGRVRLWGSLAFIIGSSGGGWLLGHYGLQSLPWLLICVMLLTAFIGLRLPGEQRSHGSDSGSLGRLLQERRFLAILLVSALLQSSHALLYGFASLHWRAAGLSEGLIGTLWTLGVLAEIVLFAAGPRLTDKLGPRGLLILGGLGGLIRWPLLAFTTDPLLLLPAQVLHGLTFGASHLGVMYLIVRNTPPVLAATAQSLNAAVTGGLAMGGALYAAGWLYQGLGGKAFHIMALLSLFGLLVAMFGFPRQPRKG